MRWPLIAALLFASAADAADTIDLGGVLPIFSATFDRLPKLRRGPISRAPRALSDPAFIWLAGGLHADPVQPGSAATWASLPHELEAYPNGDAIALGAPNPFSVEAGALVITARHLTGTPGKPYVSGALSSYPFGQTYGYFEMTARFPRGPGLWPAFWLLPLDDTWPPEIDVVEVLGQTAGVDYTSLHTRDPDQPRDFTAPNAVPDTSAGFHRYGVDWGPQTIGFYFDRRLLVTRPTPSDMHKPFYLTLNLAVGGPGSWPGPPDDATDFPARMLVRSVQVWQRPGD